MVERLIYQLDLPSDAVRARLQESADRPDLRYWTTPGLTGGRALIGEVSSNRFWWRLRHRERATFAPWLTGDIAPSASGSTVILELHSPLSTRVIVVMAGAAAAIGLIWLATTPSPTTVNYLALVIALLGLIAFPVVGARIHAGEARVLRERFEQIMAESIREPPRTGYQSRPRKGEG